MADTYGSLSLPVVVTVPGGDPALGRVGSFLKSVINGWLTQAWGGTAVDPEDRGLQPRTDAAGQLAVRNVFTHDPVKHGFNDNDLPALYLWRLRGSFEQREFDRRFDDSQWRCLWVFPPAPQEKQLLRDPWAQAVAKAVDSALYAGRYYGWVDTGDADITASTIAADADSLKTSVATSTSAQTYLGAALNGSRAGVVQSPRLEPTVTTTVATVAGDDPGIPDAGDDGPGLTEVYNIDAPIVFTFIDWYDRVRTGTVRLTEANGGETIGLGEDVKQVTAIAVPAQLAATGTFSFGTSAYAGRGSVLLDRAGLDMIRATGWERAEVQVDVLGEDLRLDHRMTYQAVQIALEATEHHTVDLSDTTRFFTPSGVDIDAIDGAASEATDAGLFTSRAEI